MMFLVNSLVKNKALIGIAVTSLFLIFAQLTLGNMGSYLYPNYILETLQFCLLLRLLAMQLL